VSDVWGSYQLNKKGLFVMRTAVTNSESSLPGRKIWRLSAKMQHVITPIVFLFIPLLIYGTFVLGTMVYSFVLSFTNWDGVSRTFKFIGFTNYIKLFNDLQFYNAIKNNIIWVLISLTIPMFLGLLLAVLVDRKIRGENIFKSIFYLPMAISFVVVAVIWSWVYEPNMGSLNIFLRAIGLGFFAKAWLASKTTVLYAIIISASWQLTGYSMILFLAGLRNISPELLEAAKIDGASDWKLFWHVVFPMLRSMRTVVVATIIINAFKVFDLVFAMTKGGPGGSSNVLAMFMYQESFLKYRMGYGSAIAVIQFLIVLIIMIIYLRGATSAEEELY
jgi:multiple sugar transport system permease protein/raffinose/stachyose/melibiose transport system permease protein